MNFYITIYVNVKHKWRTQINPRNSIYNKHNRLRNTLRCLAPHTTPVSRVFVQTQGIRNARSVMHTLFMPTKKEETRCLIRVSVMPIKTRNSHSL